MLRTSSFALPVGLGVLLLMSAPSTALGQPLTITGRVVNAATLEPIVDATVNIKDDLNSVTVTDSAGRYSIAIPRPDVTLVFAALGYAQADSSPAGRTVVNVTLSPRPLLLRELVVTGYSQQNRATVSGSVARSGELQASENLPCDGAALPSPPALEPQETPRSMSPPNPPATAIPNACSTPTLEAATAPDAFLQDLVVRLYNRQHRPTIPAPVDSSSGSVDPVPLP